ncbi:MAG: hypothetical protein R3E87_07360 [Burkholderiaceae bacterium]
MATAAEGFLAGLRAEAQDYLAQQQEQRLAAQAAEQSALNQLRLQEGEARLAEFNAGAENRQLALDEQILKRQDEIDRLRQRQQLQSIAEQARAANPQASNYELARLVSDQAQASGNTSLMATALETLRAEAASEGKRIATQDPNRALQLLGEASLIPAGYTAEVVNGQVKVSDAEGKAVSTVPFRLFGQQVNDFIGGTQTTAATLFAETQAANTAAAAAREKRLDRAGRLQVANLNARGNLLRALIGGKGSTTTDAGAAGMASAIDAAIGAPASSVPGTGSPLPGTGSPAIGAGPSVPGGAPAIAPTPSLFTPGTGISPLTEPPPGGDPGTLFPDNAQGVGAIENLRRQAASAKTGGEVASLVAQTSVSNDPSEIATVLDLAGDRMRPQQQRALTDRLAKLRATEPRPEQTRTAMLTNEITDAISGRRDMTRVQALDLAHRARAAGVNPKLIARLRSRFGALE